MVVPEELHQAQMEQFRQSIEKIKEVAITTRNFADLKNSFWNILSQSDMVIMDLESAVQEQEVKVEEAIKSAEAAGLPTEGNDYFTGLRHALDIITFLKRDLDWRNFEFDIIKAWEDKLSQRVKETNEIELNNMTLEARIKMHQEERENQRLLAEQKAAEHQQQLEIEKMRIEERLRDKELEVRRAELEKGIDPSKSRLDPPKSRLDPPKETEDEDEAEDDEVKDEDKDEDKAKVKDGDVPEQPAVSAGAILGDEVVVDLDPNVENTAKVLNPKLQINYDIVRKIIEKGMERLGSKDDLKKLYVGDMKALKVDGIAFGDLNTDEQKIIKIRLARFVDEKVRSNVTTPN